MKSMQLKRDDINSWVAFQHLFKSINGVTAACSVLIYIISIIVCICLFMFILQ